MFAYTQEAYKEALGYVRGLYAQGLVSPDTFTTDPLRALCAHQRAARHGARCVVTGVNASDVVQLSNEEDAMTYADYIAIPPLAGPDGLRSTVTAGEAVTSLRNAITIHCDDPAAAMRWLDAATARQHGCMPSTAACRAWTGTMPRARRSTALARSSYRCTTSAKRHLERPGHRLPCH